MGNTRGFDKLDRDEMEDFYYFGGSFGFFCWDS